MKEGTKKHSEQESLVATQIIRFFTGETSAEDWMISLMVAHLQAE